jgi:hypothetical protein
MTTIEDYNRLYHKHLDDDFEVLFGADPPPTASEINAFCVQIGCDFPADFRCVIGDYCNGFYAEAHESVWPHRKGGAAWMFMRGLYIYGLDGGLPEWVSLRHETPKFRELSRSNLTPCLKIISDPDPYCFTPDGQLVRWNHETYEAPLADCDFLTALERELIRVKSYKERAKIELAGNK